MSKKKPKKQTLGRTLRRVFARLLTYVGIPVIVAQVFVHFTHLEHLEIPITAGLIVFIYILAIEFRFEDLLGDNQ